MRTMRLVFISAIVATAFITTTVGAVSPVNYPVSPPGGEEEGGYFGRFFKNMYENPCSNSGAIVRFRNTGTLYNTGNLIPECGYPLASGIAGNVFTIGSGVTSTITNAIGPQGGLVIRGNNSPGTHTVRIENDLRVTGNTYLSGHIYGDLDANFRDVHVRRNLSVSGATNLTDLNVSGQTTLNRLNVTGPTILNTLRVNSGAVFGGDTIFEGDINISGALRAKKWYPSSLGNASKVGYTFEQDGDTGLFASVSNPLSNNSVLRMYLDGQPRFELNPNGTAYFAGPSREMMYINSTDSASFVYIVANAGTPANRRVFAIANRWTRTGLYNNISGDAVTIQHQGGLVGIGINAPQEKLHVHNGNIRTSHNVYAGGQVRATSFQYTSDIRKKTNIAPLQNSLQKLLALRGYSYMWKDSGEYDIGLIAQEVETVFPELIGEGKDEDGTTFKTVKYGNLVAPMIDAIGELNTKIEQQDKRIKEQEKQIEMLIERLEAQEQLIQSLQ